MTTYNTYQEAKIANPEYAIFEYQRNFGTDKEILDLFDIQGREMKECKPADHCMTVEKFLADGYKFVEGDLILDEGCIHLVSDRKTQDAWYEIDSANKPDCGDNERYILRAAALEEKPREKVEWVNGDECIYNDGKFTFVSYMCKPEEGYVVIWRSIDGIKVVYKTQISKPETPQQREYRERLESAYDLYEESQHAIGCIGYDDFDFFKKYDIQVKFWLAIVDKTNYRKDKTHGTN